MWVHVINIRCIWLMKIFKRRVYWAGSRPWGWAGMRILKGQSNTTLDGPLKRLLPVSSVLFTCFCINNWCLINHRNVFSDVPIWVHNAATAVITIAVTLSANLCVLNNLPAMFPLLTKRLMEVSGSMLIISSLSTFPGLFMGLAIKPKV